MFYFYRNVEYKHSKLGTILATLGTAMALGGAIVVVMGIADIKDAADKRMMLLLILCYAIGAAAGMALLYVGNKIGKKATEDHAKKEMQERSKQLKEMQERSRYRD